jgi:hypothetical protein
MCSAAARAAHQAAGDAELQHQVSSGQERQWNGGGYDKSGPQSTSKRE